MEVFLIPPVDRREPELAPESILPVQLGDRLFGTAKVQPEKRLQLAALQDAILTFHRCIGVDSRQSRRLFAEVDAWFASDDAEGPFTFVTICDTLNFDPGYIRRGLDRWRTRANGTRRKPPFRRDAVGIPHRVTARSLGRAA
jgi:hypothetical protein